MLIAAPGLDPGLKPMMTDSEIRAGFHKKRLWRHHHAPGTLVVDELGLMNGKCRADIAVINGTLMGYEIKSDRDSLRRFEQQIERYSAVFDRATAIVGQRHLRAAIDIAPPWWGVIVAIEGKRGGVHFKTARIGSGNPSPDGMATVRLLWCDEVEVELRSRGVAWNGPRPRRAVLYERLIAATTYDELRAIVSRRLRSRTAWRDLGQSARDDD